LILFIYLNLSIYLIFEKSISIVELWLVQKGIGVKIERILTLIICFAIDIVIHATSERDLQTALNIINIMFKEYYLKMNAA
jgi:uncharacterized protein YebE (UPF0316 family)